MLTPRPASRADLAALLGLAVAFYRDDGFDALLERLRTHLVDTGGAVLSPGSWSGSGGWANGDIRGRHLDGSIEQDRDSDDAHHDNPAFLRRHHLFEPGAPNRLRQPN